MAIPAAPKVRGHSHVVGARAGRSGETPSKFSTTRLIIKIGFNSIHKLAGFGHKAPLAQAEATVGPAGNLRVVGDNDEGTPVIAHIIPQ